MKPMWLNKKINLAACSGMKKTLKELRVETVCEQAMCPNMGECFIKNEATFLILGRYCTRMCSFCNIEKAVPLEPDPDEPYRIAEAVEKLALRHVVITSVTRDDLIDGGAKFFADTVYCIHKRLPQVTIEILIPDFNLSIAALNMVAKTSADIIGHNVETVPALYEFVRQGGDYMRSLEVLRAIKKISPLKKTKSGIMLGMGETDEDVFSVMKDLHSVGCDFLSIGQYLAPSQRHFPVKGYISPEKFSYYKEKGELLGFAHIESGPYVRSSYLASEYFTKGVIV